MPAKRYRRKGAMRKRSTRPTVRRPYGGRSNNDCYVKIEQSVALRAASTDSAYAYFRTRAGGNPNSNFNTFLTDSPEFVYQKTLWGFYEIKGIQAKLALYP